MHRSVHEGWGVEGTSYGCEAIAGDRAGESGNVFVVRENAAKVFAGSEPDAAATHASRRCQHITSLVVGVHVQGGLVNVLLRNKCTWKE